MDDLNPPNPAPASPALETQHPPSPRRIKRRLLVWLLGLHAAALMAAGVIIVRAKSSSGTKTEGEQSRVGGLLSAESKDSVGWVSIRGPIYASESGKPWEHGSEQWAKRIEALAETKGVKSIVLDINTPGGSVGAVQEIYMRIQRMKKEHPGLKFVALFGDVAASGGYYIASACDEIVAHPGTLTGSIGVIFEVTNMQGLFAKVGFKMDPIKSGAHKDIGSPARAMTPEERKIMQDLIDDTYLQFVQAVADGRKMTVEQVKPLADGRIFSGTQAIKNGLVDKLGDSHVALMEAARLGGITDAKPKVRRDGEKFSDIFEMLETRARLTLGVGPISIPLPAALSAPTHGMLYMWQGW
jgi:protease-4